MYLFKGHMGQQFPNGPNIRFGPIWRKRLLGKALRVGIWEAQPAPLPPSATGPMGLGFGGAWPPLAQPPPSLGGGAKVPPHPPI